MIINVSVRLQRVRCVIIHDVKSHEPPCVFMSRCLTRDKLNPNIFVSQRLIITNHLSFWKKIKSVFHCDRAWWWHWAEGVPCVSLISSWLQSLCLLHIQDQKPAGEKQPGRPIRSLTVSVWRLFSLRTWIKAQHMIVLTHFDPWSWFLVHVYESGLESSSVTGTMEVEVSTTTAQISTSTKLPEEQRAACFIKPSPPGSSTSPTCHCSALSSSSSAGRREEEVCLGFTTDTRQQESRLRYLTSLVDVWKRPQEMFVFLILFWGVWTFRGCWQKIKQQETRDKRQEAPVVLRALSERCRSHKSESCADGRLLCLLDAVCSVSWL